MRCRQNSVIISYTVILLFFSMLAAGCKDGKETLFELLSPGRTGIRFNNKIQDSEYFNIFTWEFIYNGSGVGIGDLNNDGLLDVFFSGNLVPNQLYLNRGNWKFVDISDIAGISASDRWCTGVAMADVNGDGWMDIYVGVANYLDNDKNYNLLFVNQGLNENGIPEFKEEAEKYGIQNCGHTTTPLFFDFDNDNDLDLYVLRNQVELISPNKYKNKVNDGSSKSNDRLFRNNGDGNFSDVTFDAGIYYEGYGMGVSAWDVNEDGWKDLYISNDYLSNDVLYINNGDGTFTNRIRDYLKHQSHNSKGHDAADLNNDGLTDMYVVDMLPAENPRQKRMLPESKYSNYVNNENFGYEYQYLRNMLQINNGPDNNGNHNFSEIGLFSSVHATDWSWSPLLADFNNDGLRDIFVSNGFPKDISDFDLAMIRLNKSLAWDKKEIMDAVPEAKTINRIFQNMDSLKFTDKTVEWGFKIPSFSNSSSYGDLDNDGDLDLVISNINNEAFVYRNNADKAPPETKQNYLRLLLKGPPMNSLGLGTKVTAFYGNGKILYQDFSIYRGYQATTEPYIHFGLGTYSAIDSMHVIWQDGKYQKFKNLKANQTVIIQYQDATPQDVPVPRPGIKAASGRLFVESANEMGITFRHEELVFNDFNIQSILPHQFSQSGPSLATGDIDGNGTIDLFIGGSLAKTGYILYQENGRFKQEQFIPDTNKMKEDLGTMLFDADGDNDLDLYIVSGGFEQELSLEAYQDRLYINRGKGNFVRSESALPEMPVSGSCVKAADFDKDGDLDLFIGGRVKPGNYPQPVNSYLLRNDSKPGKPKFTDITAQNCPALKNIGMVTDVLWTDFDNDGWFDIIIVGEWMPVTFLQNKNGVFTDVTSTTGIGHFTGWWNSLCAGDFDSDGDMDYAAGNLGLNSYYKASAEKPMTIFSGDMDRDGKHNFIISAYFPDSLGTERPYPVHGLLDLFKTNRFLEKRIKSFKQYANTPVDQLLTIDEMAASAKHSANWMQSSYIENLGGGKFKITPLPDQAQYAPVTGMLALDADQDGNLDIAVVGNEYDFNVFWGRMDALNGLILKGDGKGNFTPLDYPQTGFFVKGDAKAIVEIPVSKDKKAIIVSQNQDSLRVFRFAANTPFIMLNPDDAFAQVTLKTGPECRYEFYYGNTGLSQSARIFTIPINAAKVTVYSFSGAGRDIKINSEKK